MAVRSIGKYVAEFVANTSGFRTPIKASIGDMKEFEGASKAAISAASLAGGLIGAAIGTVVTGLGILTKQAINTAAEIGEMSQRVGIAAEEMSALSYQADLNNMSMSELEVGIKHMQVEIAGIGKEAKAAGDKGFKYFSHKVKEATSSGSKANAAFKELGLSMAQVKALSKDPAKALEAILSRLGKIEDKTKRAALAEKIFGSTKFLNLPSDMKEIMDMAGKKHQIFSDKDVADAKAFNQAVTQLKASIGGIFNVLIQNGRLEEITKLLERGANAIGMIAGGLNTVLDKVDRLPSGLIANGIRSQFPVLNAADLLMRTLELNQGGSRTQMRKALGTAR